MAWAHLGMWPWEDRGDRPQCLALPGTPAMRRGCPWAQQPPPASHLDSQPSNLSAGRALGAGGVCRGLIPPGQVVGLPRGRLEVELHPRFWGGSGHAAPRSWLRCVVTTLQAPLVSVETGAVGSGG